MEKEIIDDNSTETVDYNEEPVHYCSNCLYLGNPKITQMPGSQDLEYCPHCGSTQYTDSSIFEWESKFEAKYKQGKFLNIKKSWEKIMEM